ncbi:MAG: hypothetical protein JSW70_08965 [Syntrophobacterales bacterium]|nr:MAG: hypothetical protein JSW70_08965 [Syntrophobacterales bacterium]
MEERVERILRDKPERLCLEHSELEPISHFVSGKEVAIAELAGRDSIAAAIKALEEKEIEVLLPVYTYTGTEYGPFDYVEKAAKWLKGRLGDGRVGSLVVLGSPKFWHALNGRWVKELILRYGFYTPCIGCHVYLHASRIPLAKALGVKRVISGEREYHDGGEKINQISLAISAYRFLLFRFDVTLLTPLVKIRSNAEIDAMIGTKWYEMGDQLQCVLSANYRDAMGDFHFGPNHFDLDQILGYMSEFALPMATRAMEGLLQGEGMDYARVARQVLEERPRLTWDLEGVT